MSACISYILEPKLTILASYRVRSITSSSSPSTPVLKEPSYITTIVVVSPYDPYADLVQYLVRPDPRALVQFADEFSTVHVQLPVHLAAGLALHLGPNVL